ncbi:MAG: hypothetical protein KIT80_02895 [Chitinophagaceae bacterium]|nr:hypothetical protein [Chitinophagaceae bacterium]MCW5925832.1 hypothetical protein [Chitinophagaceae bacterium]
MKFALMLLLLTGCLQGTAQTGSDTLHQKGREYMRTGDWKNALFVFNRALQQQPGDITILKDIAYTHYLQKDFAQALDVIKPVVESDNADVQSFQIAGTIYRAIEDLKNGTKIYTRALKKFPLSGVLYCEYGELLWQKKDLSAIFQWEKGIQADPNHSGNYYNAARFYYFTTDKIWSLIYGEIFVNLESYTIRTAEIKNILTEGYQKLFTTADLLKDFNARKQSLFEKAFLTAMNGQSPIVAGGITTGKLTEVRTGFLTYWYKNYAATFPFRLFDYQKQLLESGMFEAYNEWIFSSGTSPEAYQQWVAMHQEAYDKFNHFQRGRVFKLPKDQYYQNK